MHVDEHDDQSDHADIVHATAAPLPHASDSGSAATHESPQYLVGARVRVPPVHVDEQADQAAHAIWHVSAVPHDADSESCVQSPAEPPHEWLMNARVRDLVRPSRGTP